MSGISPPTGNEQMETAADLTSTPTHSHAGTGAGADFRETMTHHAMTHHATIREVRIQYQPTTEPAFKIRDPAEVANFVRKVLYDNSREHLVALFLDGAHQIASFSVVSVGMANSTCAHPREVFQRAVSVGAVALILAHNHPSGNVQPSEEDQRTTKRMREAGELLDIGLLDHVIVSYSAHYSFKEERMI